MKIILINLKIGHENIIITIVINLALTKEFLSLKVQ